MSICLPPISRRLLLFLFCFFLVYLWHRLRSGFAISGVSPPPILFADLLSFYIFCSHLALRLSRFSPFGLLALPGAPRKAGKIENACPPADETDAAPERSLIFLLSLHLDLPSLFHLGSSHEFSRLCRQKKPRQLLGEGGKMIVDEPPNLDSHARRWDGFIVGIALPLQPSVEP